MTEHKSRQRFSNLICKASISFAVLCLLMPHTTFADDKAKNEQERVKASGEVLDALVNSESGIPTDLLNKSECVIILPSVKKGGFIIAGQYGKGLMSLPNRSEIRWSLERSYHDAVQWWQCRFSGRGPSH